MQHNDNPQFKIALVLLSALCFFGKHQPAISQVVDHSYSVMAGRERLASIERDWDQCDKISAEGSRLKCTREVLASFESEIVVVNAVVRASLPRSERAGFDRVCQSWDQYFKAEKRHWLNMSERQGTVRWIGRHDDLVQVAKDRLEFLLGYLP